MTSGLPVIVFCDVDGILLDRRTGSFDHAATLVDRLEQREVPLILCSGKTRAELERVQHWLGVSHPFIPEHGAAIFVPRGYFSEDISIARHVDQYDVIEFGMRYQQVIERLHRTASWMRADIIGFSDMSVEQLAADAGLPLAEAQLAKRHEYEEPFRLVRRDEVLRLQLCSALRAVHLRCLADGRYDRVGAPVDAALGVQWLCARYRRAFGPVMTVGVGATEQHLPFLRRMDIPVIVRGDDPGIVAAPLAELPRARVTGLDGAAGWPAVVLDVVHRAHQFAAHLLR